MAVTVSQDVYDFVSNEQVRFATAATQAENERDAAEGRRIEAQRFADDLARAVADLEVAE